MSRLRSLEQKLWVSLGKSCTNLCNKTHPNLYVSQLRFLALLAQYGSKGIRMSELRSILGVGLSSLGTTISNINSLTDDILVDNMNIDPVDHRYKIVKITDKGIEVVNDFLEDVLV